MPWNPGRTLLPLFSRSRRHGMMGMGIGMNVGGTDFTEFGLEEDCVDNTNMEISLKPPLNMISPSLTCIIRYSQSSLSLPPNIISLPQKWSSLILTTSFIMTLLIPECLPNCYRVLVRTQRITVWLVPAQNASSKGPKSSINNLRTTPWHTKTINDPFGQLLTSERDR